MKTRVLTAVVLTQIFLSTSLAWADEYPDNRPHISEMTGDDRSPGVVAVVVVALLLIGFGVGLTVGRRTRRTDK